MQKNTVFLAISALFLNLAQASDWPAWRGADSSGATTTGKYPANLSDPVWKLALPGKGCSAPIYWITRFISSAVGGEDAISAVSWEGKPVWSVKVGKRPVNIATVPAATQRRERWRAHLHLLQERQLRCRYADKLWKQNLAQARTRTVSTHRCSLPARDHGVDAGQFLAGGL